MNSTHTDSASGQQFHIRYTPNNGDKGPYWSAIYFTAEDADRELRWYRKNGYADARIFVRSVTQWREVS